MMATRRSKGGPKTLVALVPMRHRSERVPGKNYRLLVGKPLYAHVLENLLGCSEIEQVVVDTDSPVIMEGIAAQFPSVRVIERPERLRGGEVSTNEIILHDVTEVPSRFYLQTHSTNPLLRRETIARAIGAFFAGLPDYDSLFTVTRLQKRLWDPGGQPINHDPNALLRTQDLPPIYEENSCLYIFEGTTMVERRNRLGHRPLMFETEVLESWDIDEEIDFEIAEFLMRRRHEHET
jgi:CMP-N-acetylneuraminic acid synthetase